MTYEQLLEDLLSVQRMDPDLMARFHEFIMKMEACQRYSDAMKAVTNVRNTRRT